MPGQMPYVASVAPIALAEALLNGDGSPQHKLEVLRAMDAAEHFMDAALEFRDTPAVRAYIAHVNTDWFGLTPTASGWAAQSPYDPDTNPTTGFWDGWYIEDAEAICRTAVVAALNLALGRNGHGRPTRNDRITLLWVCATEGFDVVLRRWSGNTLMSFVTPGIQDQPLATDLAAGPFNGSTGYACPPTDFTARNALWVVGDRYTAGHYDDYVTSGPVVTVQPSIEDGGVQ